MAIPDYQTLTLPALKIAGDGQEHGSAAAITAYRSALEVYTREQLPQDWAVTQNNLGIALWDQAARTEGPKARSFWPRR